MNVRDAIGLLITAVGIAILGVGYKVLGGMWTWFGVSAIGHGCGVLALSARAHYIEKRLRDYRGPGDWDSVTNPAALLAPIRSVAVIVAAVTAEAVNELAF